MDFHCDIAKIWMRCGEAQHGLAIATADFEEQRVRLTENRRAGQLTGERYLVAR